MREPANKYSEVNSRTVASVCARHSASTLTGARGARQSEAYWSAIVGNGGKESQCGWCRDRWGLSWQITPRTLMDALAVEGAEAKRAFSAMTSMKKIDVATIEAARRG